MFYLIKENNNNFNNNNCTDGTHWDLGVKYGKENVIGHFGREDFAEHWRDFYNGDISKEEHRRWLDYEC